MDHYFQKTLSHILGQPGIKFSTSLHFELLANLITGCETTLSVLYSQITTIFCTLHIFDLLKGQLISDHISPYNSCPNTNEKLTIF